MIALDNPNLYIKFIKVIELTEGKTFDRPTSLLLKGDFIAIDEHGFFYKFNVQPPYPGWKSGYRSMWRKDAKTEKTAFSWREHWAHLPAWLGYIDVDKIPHKVLFEPSTK